MEPIIFAFAGKGGVGKTSLSAAFIRALTARFPDKKLLAVDADPAVGLLTALGAEPELTLDDVRMKIAESIDRGDTADAVALLGEARYHLLDCILERGNLSVLAIGRPEAAGCYCKVNAYLKQVLETVAGNYDFVVIDGEAGIEQINRRVMETVTALVLVSDGSRKGVQVIKTIRDVAARLMSPKKTGVIFNRVSPAFDPDGIEDLPPVLALIGDDRNQTETDMRGDTVFSLPPDAPVLAGAEAALRTLLEGTPYALI